MSSLAAEDDRRKIQAQYEAALLNFESQQFSAAEQSLMRLVKDHPEDEPTRQLADRLAQAQSQSTPFDSIWTLGGK